MLSLKNILKENTAAMGIVVGIYSLQHGNSNWTHHLKNRFMQKGAFLKENKFHFWGKDNEIAFGHKARINHCRFTIIRNNCKIIIGGSSTIVSNVHFWCQDDNSCTIIGNDFTMEGGHIAATEGESITIDKECLFSGDVEIRNGDSNSILDIMSVH